MTEKKLRGGHRAMATKLSSKIEDLIQEPELDSLSLKATAKALCYHRDKILEYDVIIQGNLSEETIISDMEEASNRLYAIEKSISIVEDCLSRANENPNSSILSDSNKNSKINVKLPVVSLPTFKGNTLEWAHFWDVFRSAIHVRSDLAEAQKFTYLIGQLKDEALSLVDGFTTTDAHYIEAITLLQETYGDPKRIIQSHLHAIFDMPSPGPTSSELSKFRSTYECHLRGLKVLETNVDEAGFVLAALLLRKLPLRIRDNINRAARSNYWELGEFRKAINAEILFLQDSEPKEAFCREDSKPKKYEKSNKYNYKTSPPKKSSINTIHIKKEGNKVLSCRICFEKHHLKDCTKYKTNLEKGNRVKELHLCAKCFSNTHSTSNCNTTIACKECNGKHSSWLCFKSEEKSVTAVAHVTPSQNSSGVALATAMVQIQSSNKEKRVRALFDQGSQKTFLLSSVAKELKLPSIGTVVLSLDGFNSKGKVKTYNLVKFNLNCGNSLVTITAILIESLPTRIHMPGISRAISELKKINIQLADPDIRDNVTDISLLVGSDYYFEIVTGYNSYNAINLINSKVGNMVVGKLPISGESSFTNVATVLKVTASNDSLDTTLQKFWSLDSIGINPNELSSNDHEAINIFRSKISYCNGHYVVPLPWKQLNIKLKSNYPLALGRLHSLLKNLDKHNMTDCYDNLIKEQINMGFIEKVNNPCTYDGYYIPHMSVIKDSSTTPLRIVYDCSAGKPSLNECLLSGPPLTSDLGLVLLRFRLHKFICISDIEKAFLNVHLHSDDKDYTRFLWPENPQNKDSPLITYRFRVVLFGATCSPFLLNATIQYHLERNDSEIAKNILNGLYVDNLIYTNDNEEKISEFYKESTEIMQDAGFNVREWVTNSPQLNKLIYLDKKGAEQKEQVKLLGLAWLKESDCIAFPDRLVDSQADTKREILRNFSKVFDPLGILLPVTIKARIFMQTLWKLKLAWDEHLCNDLKENWENISNDINEALECRVARQVPIEDSVIHAFADASSKAYGACIYLSNNESSRLLIAKAKVAPIKTLTIPQMELTAAVLASRLVVYTLKSYAHLAVSKVYLWSDSRVALSWINSDRILKNYIQNRVDEINKLLPSGDWKFVPTKDNPADLLTRGVASKYFLESSLWFEGPDWLKDKSSWPSSTDFLEDSNSVESVLLFSESECKKEKETLLSLKDYNCLHKLFKVTVLVQRFINNLKMKVRKDTNLKRSIQVDSLILHCIEPADIIKAEMFWIRNIQEESFSEEVNYLLGNKKSKTPNLILQYNLFLEDGCLHCRKRLDFSSLEYSVKYPILLPNKHPYTKLLILKVHRDNGHPGISQMIVLIRQKFWFSRMRQTIKAILYSCVICRKVLGGHYKRPPVPPLPEDRLIEARPFTVSGLDYTGAFYVKQRGKQVHKVYILLFTCATTRALHLELVNDMTCESFIRAFKRFISKRSIPSVIYSDNALTFKKASNYLNAMHSKIATQSYLQDNLIQWKFISPKAPWFGGFWERLVGITKTSLKKILLNSLVSRDEFQTILSEIEMRLNDRPLTYVSDGLEDPNPLTPSDLMYGQKAGKSEISDEYVDQVFNKTFITRRQQYSNRLVNHFWERWSKEYLTSLREFHFKSQGNIPKVGDVVLVKEDIPRNRWKMAKVLKLHKGRDGHFRSATVKTANAIYDRPIIKLYPLEVNDEDDPSNSNYSIEKQSRKAAIIAKERMAKMS